MPDEVPYHAGNAIPGETVFLKQYGDRRTGTNILRALLMRNFRNAVVLMHVLGDKHSPPVAMERLWDEVASAPDAAWEFATRATWQAPAETTSRESPRQRAYLRQIAEPLTAAVCSGRLHFLISVKNPYAWAMSLTAWRGWIPHLRWLPLPSRRAAWRRTLETRIRGACRILNRNYAAWLKLRDRFPERTSIIRVEDLSADPRAVLDDVARRHGLVYRDENMVFIDRAAKAAPWDHSPLGERFVSFTTRRKAIERRLAPVADVIHAAVSEETNWDLFGRLSYTPRPDAAR